MGRRRQCVCRRRLLQLEPCLNRVKGVAQGGFHQAGGSAGHQMMDGLGMLLLLLLLLLRHLTCVPISASSAYK